MALRASMVSKIWASLEKSPFTVADFDVSFVAGPLLEVKFLHKPEFSFVIREDYTGDLILVESPGTHLLVEKKTLGTLDDAPTKLLDWTRNVRDELRATIPLVNEFDDLRRLVEAHINDHLDSPDEPFTIEEADALRQKLDQLDTRFNEMQQQSELTQREVERLTKELASLKENLGAYPKGVWYKTAASRLWVTFSKIVTSKESQKLLARAAGKALGIDPPES